MTKDKSLSLRNYNILRKDKNQYGGGVLIMLKKNIIYEELFIRTDLDAIAVKVTIDDASYNKCKKKFLFVQTRDPYYLLLNIQRRITTLYSR